VDIEFTAPEKAGTAERIGYDYLINATGPRLRFEATEGMGPEGFTESVCTTDHAVEANRKLRQLIEVLKSGRPPTLVVGMGHGTCTCEGAAFEYVFNVDHESPRGRRP
jgi:sulfide:quinone oxidoreductase